MSLDNLYADLYRLDRQPRGRFTNGRFPWRDRLPRRQIVNREMTDSCSHIAGLARQPRSDRRSLHVRVAAVVSAAGLQKPARGVELERQLRPLLSGERQRMAATRTTGLDEQQVSRDNIRAPTSLVLPRRGSRPVGSDGWPGPIRGVSTLRGPATGTGGWKRSLSACNSVCLIDGR